MGGLETRVPSLRSIEVASGHRLLLRMAWEARDGLHWAYNYALMRRIAMAWYCFLAIQEGFLSDNHSEQSSARRNA